MNQFISFVVVFFCCAHFQQSASVKAINVVSYLSRLGYLPPEYKNSETANLITDESLKSALEDYQNFYGLNVTGVADEETLKLMNTPRCGLPDKIWRNSKSEDYNLAIGWKTTNLTYKVTKYSKDRDLKPKDVDAAMVTIFRIWSKYTILKFSNGVTLRKVDIEIRFEVGDHGDGDPFDGSGGRTLAHAFYPGPGLGGDLHFDDDEPWTATIRSYTKTQIDKVGTHEVGHALGLGHSRIQQAIMYAYYKNDNYELELSRDDIEGIQVLYGREDGSGVTSELPYVPGIPICSANLSDYVLFTDTDRKTYFISGIHYWHVTDAGVINKQSQLIYRRWVGLKTHVDAAVVFQGVTFFFQDNLIYGFNRNKALLKGYPKTIGNQFPGFPSYIDSALVFNSKIYVFKGEKYWGYPVSIWSRWFGKKYPKQLKPKWGRGVPTGTYTALTYTNGRNYFFKGTSYWKYNDRKRNVEIGYPKDFNTNWLHCPQIQ